MLVGDSAKARKGSSWDHVCRLLDLADPTLVSATAHGLTESVRLQAIH